MPEPAMRRFIDIANLHTTFPLTETEFSTPSKKTTYYEVGKLALQLLPILLSRIEALEDPEVYDFIVRLRNQPPFYLIKNDPLELEKVKAAQAIEDFLEV